MSVVIHPATPDDAAFIGYACVSSARSQLARGWFEIVLQRDEAFCLEFAKYLTIAKARSWWHWSLFQVAEVDGVVASALCGFGDESVYYHSREAMAEAATKMGIPKSEYEQFRSRGHFIVSPATSEDRAWTIENVATAEAYRGRGLVQKLIDAEIELARAANFKRMQVSFFIGNTPAERAYTKAGFKFAEQKTAPDFQAALGIPGVIRYARDI